MEGGLFIALYDEKSLKLYLNKGLYGFLMKPVLYWLIMLAAEKGQMFFSF